MNYWLIKSEPSVFPWKQLLKDKKAVWDGVRNYQARNNLREMKKGDLCLFYHSNEGKEIVGIATVKREAYQDPGTDDANWVAVDVAPFKTLKNPVSLSVIKADKKLAGMELVKLSRISVSKVSPKEYEYIIQLSEN